MSKRNTCLLLATELWGNVRYTTKTDSQSSWTQMIVNSGLPSWILCRKLQMHVGLRAILYWVGLFGNCRLSRVSVFCTWRVKIPPSCMGTSLGLCVSPPADPNALLSRHIFYNTHFTILKWNACISSSYTCNFKKKKNQYNVLTVV